jgi:regulator of protease activity HflC (stomatin/prohibitin superfamily)
MNETKTPFDFDILKTSFRLPEFPGLTRLLSKLRYLIGIGAGIFILYLAFFVYVEPGQFGIKVIRIGPGRGVQHEIYSPGLHFMLPLGIHQMYLLPKNIQLLELTNFPTTAARFSRYDKAAHIQTSDGFFVDVDVSILYRIADPYLVFTKIGPGYLFEDNGILPKAEPVLKSTLGELTTEEFYNSPLRSKKTESAKNLLNKELASKGLQVEQVMVRYFKYSDEIQKNIEEKKLKDQLVFKNMAEAKSAIEEATLKKIIQEGEMTVGVKLEEGEAYITRKQAERDLYVRKKTAEADLLVKLAEAQRVELKNSAMEGEGAQRMVGLQMADLYKGLETIILPSDGPNGVNPLSLEKTLSLFDVRGKGENK